jgi:tetratricopeptide (TPR) repeat protein
MAGFGPAIFLKYTPMEPSATALEPPDLDTEVARLRGLLEQDRHQEVADAVPGLLAAEPSHRDLLYLQAVAQRMLHRIPEALATLARLEAYHPGYPRLYQERGHCHIFLRAAPEAIAAFERATQLNPALPASWKALQTLYRMTGRMAEAERAGQHVAKLASLPVEVVTARSMLADGNLVEAEHIIRPFLRLHGEHIEGMRVLANIAAENEFPNDAEILLEAVLKLAPDYYSARYDYVLALVDLHKHGKAREEIEKLIAADPANPANRITLASILLALGELDEAVARYRKLVAELPEDAEVTQSLGHALKTLGRQDEAIAAYRRAAEVRPGFGEAYWSLANLKTYRFTDEELDRMRHHEAQATVQAVDRYHLCFALGKGLEDRGEYAESFTCYERGNALKKLEVRYRAGPHERSSRRQREICTAEFFAGRRGWGCDSAAPIFVLGLPRAGSTLLEQILASHSQIEGTMELANIPRLVGALSGRERPGDTPYPDLLADLTAEQCRQFGENYLRDTLDYRTGKPFFVDKMPNNFRNIALIQMMLPNAKIIDARRDPMDCCFSNFKQLYARGHHFAYGLEDIGRYYRLYVEMMDHWDRVLPGRILRVQHEDVLADLEGSVRRILDYCGLPFEPACVEFHKTERTVHTASAAQVRRPINRDGVDQWKPYAEWLGPLRDALGPLVKT